MKTQIQIVIFAIVNIISFCLLKNVVIAGQIHTLKNISSPDVIVLDSLPYLGQTPPDTIPEIFGPGFVSSTSADEYSICFSADGKEIYFSRYTANVSNTIWWTHEINNVWTTPVNAPFTGTFYNSEPFITYDNQKMYFISERGATNDFQIWFMTRNGSSWSTPQKLTAPFSQDSIKMFPTAAINGNLYFTQFGASMKGRFYKARYINGAFETPSELSSTLNAYYSSGHAFIAPDESYFLFDAIPTQSSTGSLIYVSFKKQDSTWGNPILLGSNINATNNQYCPYISPDGKYMFFTKQGNIWWVDAKVVTRLKPVGIIPVSNKIADNFMLFQNYPNPFNPSTKIKFTIPENGKWKAGYGNVSLRVYNVLGKEIATLVNETLRAGEYEVTFSADNYDGITSGVYFYRLETGGSVLLRKMILMK